MNNRGTTQSKLFKQCEQFVKNLYRNLEDEPQKLKTFIDLFHRGKRPNNNVLESQIKLVDLIQDLPDLVRQLNQLVPDEFKVPELDIEEPPQKEIDEPIDINTIFTELNKKRPDKVKELIDLLQQNKEKQNKNHIQVIKDTVCRILKDEPTHLNAFLKLIEQKMGEAPATAEEEEPEQNEIVLNNTEKVVEAETKKKPKQKPNRFEKVFGTQRPQNQRGFRRREVENNTQIMVTKEVPEIPLSSTIRTEMYLFEYLEKTLGPEAYNELAKVIYLYTECIISAHEVFQMTKHYFEGKEHYFTFFQDIIHIREPIRRKNTAVYKPLNEVDFKKFNCERTKSYTKLPEHFTYAKNPKRRKYPEAGSVLNKSWVSVPTGSEVNFTVNKKNSYEANLIACEEERYEFDIAIYSYNMTVKWLLALENQKTDEERNNLVTKILKLKVVQKVYGNNPEIIDIFKKNPVSVSKIFLERVQTKLQELRDTKWNQAKKKWLETAVQNFHRALDHRSYFFKQSEKKLTSYKHFVADAQTRHKELNAEDNLEVIIDKKIFLSY